MRLPKTFRIAALIIASLFAVYLFIESSGVLDDRPYRVVPHGDHNHYLPHDAEDLPIDAFPTEPPREGETITPDGRVVRE